LAGLACALALVGGCAVSHRHVATPMEIEPAQTASKADLIAKYNSEAVPVQTITAAVRMSPTAGSAVNGVIEQYHEVTGYILAARPASIRVIGQAPVVATDIFDMVSDGQTFRIFIPSKNEFIVGPDELVHAAKKPIENLRPQHLIDALLWQEINSNEPVLLEQTEVLPKRYYVLTVVKNNPQDWTIDRKIWFDRADLQVTRIQIFGAGGELVSDVHYSNWQVSLGVNYPREIDLSRPLDDYQLAISISQLTLNQPIDAQKFQLAQPKGTKLVQLTNEGQP
jgi:outer membrane lipoprotein-sorting protein